MEKVYFKTFGCSNNFSEGEVMKGLVVEKGYETVEYPENADVIIVNICVVKGDNQALKTIRELKENYPFKAFIVTGCIPNKTAERIREIDENISLMNTHNFKEIVSVIEETMNDNSITALSKEYGEKICLPKVRDNPVIGIVPILNGCSGLCSYCIVRKIKGKLYSFSSENVVKEVKKCLRDGCKEIWITSQDNAAYMLDKQSKSELPSLLKEIISIPGDFKVRVGMMNLNHLKPVLDELISVFKSSKVFKFLHLPVQSGNDEILKNMERIYHVSDFVDVISKFRSEIPEITISTDIIVGFPGETKEQFMDSVELVRKVKPDVLNISRFQAIPSTKAASMSGQIHGNETKERSRFLTSQFDWIAFENNAKWRRWEGEVLIDEIGKEGTFIGRNLAYKPVILEGKFSLGEKVNVRIKDITKYDLRGEEA